MSMTEVEGVEDLIRRVRRTLWLTRGLRLLTASFWVTVGLSLPLAIGANLAGPQPPWLFAVALLAPSLGAVFLASRAPALDQAAAVIDRQFDTHDLISTAWEQIALPEAERSPAYGAVLSQAAKRCFELTEAGRHLSLRPSIRHLFAPLVALAFSLAFFAWLSDASQNPGNDVSHDAPQTSDDSGPAATRTVLEEVARLLVPATPVSSDPIKNGASGMDVPAAAASLSSSAKLAAGTHDASDGTPSPRTRVRMTGHPSTGSLSAGVSNDRRRDGGDDAAGNGASFAPEQRQRVELVVPTGPSDASSVSAAASFAGAGSVPGRGSHDIELEPGLSPKVKGHGTADALAASSSTDAVGNVRLGPLVAAYAKTYLAKITTGQ